MCRLVKTVKSGIATLRFNDPKKLNSWGAQMMTAFKQEMIHTAEDPGVNATILTGTGNFYSAGADLAGLIRVAPPRVLLDEVAAKNQALFDIFLDYPKPLFIAVNGPAVGAPVTSASLCDAIFATDNATFHTPFAKLGLVPEGCSSFWFEKKMNAQTAQQMLTEGRKLTAQDALEAGLVDAIIPAEKLLEHTQAAAEQWVQEKKPRAIDSLGVREELKRVNARESRELADACLSERFLQAMEEFTREKGRTQAAMLFKVLRVTRPVWFRLI